MPSTVEIHVEFLGIPRARAGLDDAVLRASTLGELLAELGQRFPSLEGECLHAGTLARGYLLSINGQRFTTDVHECLQAGDRVLLLSSDAGG